MNLSQFEDKYDSYVASIEELEGGNVAIEFSETGKIMWLKNILNEKVGYEYLSGTPSMVGTTTYYFRPKP